MLIGDNYLTNQIRFLYFRNCTVWFCLFPAQDAHFLVSSKNFEIERNSSLKNWIWLEEYVVHFQQTSDLFLSSIGRSWEKKSFLNLHYTLELQRKIERFSINSCKLQCSHQLQRTGTFESTLFIVEFIINDFRRQ